jgi:hypothetical protein
LAPLALLAPLAPLAPLAGGAIFVLEALLAPLAPLAGGAIFVLEALLAPLALLVGGAIFEFALGAFVLAGGGAVGGAVVGPNGFIDPIVDPKFPISILCGSFVNL